MDRTPKPGEFYRHFKNKMYQIVAVATHSETKEKLVIYQALYDDFGIYARPLDMFVSEVDHEKYPDVKQKYRFEKVEPGGSQGRAYEDDMHKPVNRVTDTLDNSRDNNNVESNKSIQDDAVNNDIMQLNEVHDERKLENKIQNEVVQTGMTQKSTLQDQASSTDTEDEQTPDPHLMEFLDADTFEEKYNILVSMRDTITDRLIDDIAVVMDIVIPEGPLTKRYEDLKNTIKTRQYYEFSNRLR